LQKGGEAGRRDGKEGTTEERSEDEKREIEEERFSTFIPASCKG
jgi:hypothetical protein